MYVHVNVYVQREGRTVPSRALRFHFSSLALPFLTAVTVFGLLVAASFLNTEALFLVVA